MATATSTTSYLDPPQLIGRPNADGTISITPLELKKLNDYNYAVAKMIQGGLNLANLNKETNQKFTDIEGNITELETTAEGLTLNVSNLAGDLTSLSVTVDGMRVADETGSYTIIDGDKLESRDHDTGKIVRIEDGAVTSAGSTNHLTVNNGGIYLGDSTSYEPVSIYYEADSGKFFLYCGTGVKIESGINLSIDSSGTIYIGASAGKSGNVTIGQASGNVNLVGNVSVNGVPI